MNDRVQKITIYRILAISIISFLVVDCSNSIDMPSPISSIKKHNAVLNQLNRKTIITSLEVRSENRLQNANITAIPAPISISQSRIHLANFRKKIDFSDQRNTKSSHIVCNRDYKYIQKGNYRGGNTYTVKNGDTLFYVAWITGNDFRDLAKLNNIQTPYNLYPGKILQIRNYKDELLKNGDLKLTSKTKKIVMFKREDVYSNRASEKKTDNKVLFNNRESKKTIALPITSSAIIPSKLPNNAICQKTSIFTWHWPTRCTVSIDTHLLSTDGSNGINIAGNRGQEIVAAADGRVVYAGNALRGYGNLIIIKHNKDYLSAYAHNDAILVREQQKVKAGQKIATMGSSGTNSTRLHFEIRYKGKPVNPLQYLPKK